MPQRRDDAALEDFSATFTARTPLGALARVASRPAGDEGSLVELEPPGAARAPRRILRRATLVLLLAGALAAPVVTRPVATSGGTSVAPADADAVRAADPGAGGEASGAAVADASTPDPVAFAGHDGLVLHLPAHDVVRVGYHEASYPSALPLAPLGTNVDNQNTTKFASRDATAGPDYLVLSSRGRPTAATSAVDVVLRAGTPVTSVVDGRVSLVEPYLLYGRHPDTRIEIVPDARPDLRVIAIHVDGVRVAVGDRVAAGRTVLADSANRFPFPSHIDRYAEGEPEPHVHLEVKIPDPILD